MFKIVTARKVEEEVIDESTTFERTGHIDQFRRRLPLLEEQVTAWVDAASGAAEFCDVLF